MVCEVEVAGRPCWDEGAGIFEYPPDGSCWIMCAMHLMMFEGMYAAMRRWVWERGPVKPVDHTGTARQRP